MRKTDDFKPIYDYFYGEETLQFAFYRVPKLLVIAPEFKELSNDAKILYGLLLDRTSLSIKNGWVDEYNRVYVIYTVENIMTDLNVGTGKAVKTLKILEEYHLISKKRLGQGKPTRLYVHNFFKSFNFETFENRNSRISKNENLGFSNEENLNFQKENSKVLDMKNLKFQNLKSNNTDINNNKNNYINQSISAIEKIEIYKRIIKENIEYDNYRPYMNEQDGKLFDELLNIMCDIVSIDRNDIKINGCEYPHSLVKSVYLKLTYEHLLYVMRSMENTTTHINNIRAYLISTLYNSFSSLEYNKQQRVNNDLYGRKKED